MAERDMLDVDCDSCGVRISLDSSIVRIKHLLDKPVECPICRNARVSKEKELFEMGDNGVNSDDEEITHRRLRVPSANQSFF